MGKDTKYMMTNPHVFDFIVRNSTIQKFTKYKKYLTT